MKETEIQKNVFIRYIVHLVETRHCLVSTRCTITILLISLSSCLTPFDPEIDSAEEGYLVVEGALDISDDIGEIFLSRTKALDAVNQKNFEAGAKVWVETENGNEFPFQYQDSGKYVASFQNFNRNSQVRLNIVTASQEHFQSDFVPFKQSPEIESITWEANDDGLSFFVDTRGIDNDTRYYRWEFIETAEYNSLFISLGIYDENLGQLVERDQETQNIYICWADEHSQKILLGNTTTLAEDVITHKKIHTVPPDSWKHQFKYSILVKQFAVTAAEYDYWYNVQQSNENVGSIFDAQPSNIGSNIHAMTKPDNPVFGYFSLGASAEKRVFVLPTELPSWERFANIPRDCEEDDLVFIPLNQFYADPLAHEVAEIVYDLSGRMIGINTAPIECIVCSYANRGYSTKPDFW